MTFMLFCSLCIMCASLLQDDCISKSMAMFDTVLWWDLDPLLCSHFDWSYQPTDSVIYHIWAVGEADRPWYSYSHPQLDCAEGRLTIFIYHLLCTMKLLLFEDLAYFLYTISYKIEFQLLSKSSPLRFFNWLCVEGSIKIKSNLYFSF